MSRWMIVLVACALTAMACAQDEPLTLVEGLARIRDLGDEGRGDEALEVAEELVAAYSESAEAVLWRGIAYRGIDEAQAARADSERAVALDPANLRAQYLLALADVPDYDLQALEAAMRPFVDLCADAVAANPDNAEAYLHRAFALNMIGETAAAEADLRRALELDPENMETLNALAGLLRADRRAEAIALLERVIELRPLNVYAHEDLGCRYEADGHPRNRAR